MYPSLSPFRNFVHGNSVILDFIMRMTFWKPHSLHVRPARPLCTLHLCSHHALSGIVYDQRSFSFFFGFSCNLLIMFNWRRPHRMVMLTAVITTIIHWGILHGNCIRIISFSYRKKKWISFCYFFLFAFFKLRLICWFVQIEVAFFEQYFFLLCVGRENSIVSGKTAFTNGNCCQFEAIRAFGMIIDEFIVHVSTE